MKGNNRKVLYLLSGLGADERAFQNLDFKNFTVIFIQWIAPKEQENIEDYASRLLDQITMTNPILIGLSFGGIIAIEIAKQIKTSQVILIASAKTKNEIPFYFRFAGFLGLHKFLPVELLKKSNFISHWFFGATSASEQLLLQQIIADTDTFFLSWAIDKVVKWANTTPINNLFHIHGKSDRILPLCFIKCDVIIKNGGHFMTLNKAGELNDILRQQL